MPAASYCLEYDFVVIYCIFIGIARILHYPLSRPMLNCTNYRTIYHYFFIVVVCTCCLLFYGYG